MVGVVMGWWVPWGGQWHEVGGAVGWQMIGGVVVGAMGLQIIWGGGCYGVWGAVGWQMIRVGGVMG